MDIDQGQGGKRRKAEETDGDSHRPTALVGKEYHPGRMTPKSVHKSLADLVRQRVSPAHDVLGVLVEHFHHGPGMAGVGQIGFDYVTSEAGSCSI